MWLSSSPALSMSPPPYRPGITPDPAAPGSALPRRSVLYVEDNPINAMLLREVLKSRPHIELHVAVDGASGIEMARELQPDLLLLDMQLPDMSGLDVRGALREHAATRELPCMALTGSVLDADIAKARAEGFIGYVTKPLDLPSFLARLDAFFAGDQSRR